ncbi:transporter [Paenimyroides ceti]
MKHSLIITLFLICFQSYGQYTTEINTNRPSLSMGAYSVSKGIIQIETGLGMQKDSYDSETYNDRIGADVQLRFGVMNENLELIADFKYDATNQTVYATENKFSGFRNATIGAKYLLYDSYKNYVDKVNVLSWRANQRYKWRRLVPAVSVFVGADFKSDKYWHPNMPAASIKGMIITQQHISNHLSFVTNLIIENAENDDFRSYGYIATLSYGFNQRWSVFAENQGYFREYEGEKIPFKDDCIFRAGFTFLVHRNLQFDISGGTGIGDNPQKYLGQIGVSWRNHKKIIFKDPYEL